MCSNIALAKIKYSLPIFQEDYHHIKPKSGIILCLPGAAFKNVIPGLLHLKITTRIIYLADVQPGYQAAADTQPSPMEKWSGKKRNDVLASWLLDAIHATHSQA